jgi:hypothetical protein
MGTSVGGAKRPPRWLLIDTLNSPLTLKNAEITASLNFAEKSLSFQQNHRKLAYLAYFKMSFVTKSFKNCKNAHVSFFENHVFPFSPQKSLKNWKIAHFYVFIKPLPLIFIATDILISLHRSRKSQLEFPL